jgi:hypothetical protein
LQWKQGKAENLDNRVGTMFYNQILNLMKKIRMMLPMLAFVLAAGAAVAGSFLPGISAYRTAGGDCVSGNTEQANCQLSSNPNYQICTIAVGSSHPQAFKNADCTGVLRNIPN